MDIIKKSKGAPRKPDQDKAVYVGIRLTAARKLKLKQLGGARWLSGILDNCEQPTEYKE